MFIYFIILFLSVGFCIYIRKRRTFNLENDHCLITGGSSGIGLEIGILAAQLGANVTIVARSKERLEAAKEKIYSSAKSPQQKVLIFSEDITQNEPNLEHLVKEAEDHSGAITLLVNCAGNAISSRFEDTPSQSFVDMLNINYLGSVHMTKAVLPFMKERKHGRIVFVSSLAGLIGLYGYTAYSGSKYAIRGLAEALLMEVKPYNISITVSFPPDTDTPGFAEENKTKPIETAKISESGGLYSAETVAAKTLYDALNKKFTSTVGFEGWMLSTVCSGTMPITSGLGLIVQFLTMGIFRLAISVYLKQCDRTIKNCAKDKEKR